MNLYRHLPLILLLSVFTAIQVIIHGYYIGLNSILLYIILMICLGLCWIALMLGNYRGAWSIKNVATNFKRFFHEGKIVVVIIIFINYIVFMVTGHLIKYGLFLKSDLSPLLCVWANLQLILAIRLLIDYPRQNKHLNP